MLLWWRCQSPVAHSCRLLNHPDSFCGGMFKLNTKLDADSLLYILNVMATQYTCSLKGVHHSHWLVQWSRLCSHMRIPGHSPWLPGCIDVAQNCSRYVNNGWTSSGQTLYIFWVEKNRESVLLFKQSKQVQQIKILQSLVVGAWVSLMLLLHFFVPVIEFITKRWWSASAHKICP